jgi:hypothetical protein
MKKSRTDAMRSPTGAVPNNADYYWYWLGGEEAEGVEEKWKGHLNS